MKNSLLHHLNIDLGHIHLLAKLGRKLGLLQRLGVYAGCHLGRQGGLQVPSLQREIDQVWYERYDEKGLERAEGLRSRGWLGFNTDCRKLQKIPRVARKVKVACRSQRGNRAGPPIVSRRMHRFVNGEMVLVN